MNSNMVKPEKFGHLHLVYHFAVPLTFLFSVCDVNNKKLFLGMLT